MSNDNVLVSATIKTWACTNPACPAIAVSGKPYHQDTDPHNPWQQSPGMFPDVPLGNCPSCYKAGQGSFSMELYGVEEPSAIQMSVASDEALTARQVEDVDANGQPIMEESGEYREKLINDNGTPRFVQEPIMQPKMVPAPKTQVDALKLQRDKSLDELEKVAVKEVTPTTDEPADEPARTR